MDKANRPASMAINDTKRSIIRGITGSGLPPVVLEMILAPIYAEIVRAAEDQTKQESEAYYKMMAETAGKPEGDGQDENETGSV